MHVIRAPHNHQRPGGGRQAVQLRGRPTVVDRTDAFSATARTDGGAAGADAAPDLLRPVAPLGLDAAGDADREAG